jgi:hypothetical protein
MLDVRPSVAFLQCVTHACAGIICSCVVLPGLSTAHMASSIFASCAPGFCPTQRINNVCFLQLLRTSSVVLIRRKGKGKVAPVLNNNLHTMKTRGEV